MATHTPVEADPKEIQRAQHMWAGFTKLSKYAVVVTIVTLAILGLLFIDW